ncbi:MAG: hypothetical protein U0361_13840 [Nitrospiraceae bacterium]
MDRVSVCDSQAPSDDAVQLPDGSQFARAWLGVQGAQGVFCPAHFLKEKVKRLYRPSVLPSLLPNLIDASVVAPSVDQPTFTYLARWIS